MNRKHGIIAVALVTGALASLGIMRLATPPVAAAQAMNPSVQESLNNLDKRLTALEKLAAKPAQSATTTGTLRPGYPAATTVVQGNAPMSQDVVIQGEVDTLKSQLAKLQLQFANHYHNYTLWNDPGSAHGIETILQCQGYGKPCTSATSLSEITVLVPPNVTPTSQSYTVKTSGPLQPSN